MIDKHFIVFRSPIPSRDCQRVADALGTQPAASIANQANEYVYVRLWQTDRFVGTGLWPDSTDIIVEREDALKALGL